MTRFSRAALIVSNFVDQTGQLAFITNIHPSKQYKYLLEHQKTPSFTTLMEVAAAHTLIKEKMNSFSDFEQKSGQTSNPARYEQYHYNSHSDCLH